MFNLIRNTGKLCNQRNAVSSIKCMYPFYNYQRKFASNDHQIIFDRNVKKLQKERAANE